MSTESEQPQPKKPQQRTFTPPRKRVEPPAPKPAPKQPAEQDDEYDIERDF